MADDDGRVGLAVQLRADDCSKRGARRLRHPATISRSAGVYDLPFGKGKTYLPERLGGPCARRMASQRHLQRLLRLPFTVTASGASLNAPNNTQTADQVLPTVAKLGGIGPGHPYYDPNAFAPVTAVRFGTSGRNILRAPATFNTNVSLFRTFPINERFSLQFRAESYQPVEHAAFPRAERECLFG